MPTTSELNNLKLHYFAEINGSTTIGRGEFIRLLLEDAGVDFEYVRYTFPQWGKHKRELLAQNVPKPTLPYINIDGKYYGKTIPIMRLLARKLGKYEGRNDEEVFLLDSYIDLINDWVLQFYRYSSGKADADTYLSKQAPEAYQAIELMLSQNSAGPYLLGDAISYVDFYLYHAIEDDGTKITADNYPHIYTFIQAFENRPNMKKYLATDRK